MLVLFDVQSVLQGRKWEDRGFLEPLFLPASIFHHRDSLTRLMCRRKANRFRNMQTHLLSDKHDGFKKCNWRGMLDDDLLTSKTSINCLLFFSERSKNKFVSNVFFLTLRELKLNFLSQVSVGAGFPGDADRSGADYRRLHSGDAWRERRYRPRQCPGGGSQKTLQETQRLREFIPQQVKKLLLE